MTARMTDVQKKRHGLEVLLRDVSREKAAATAIDIRIQTGISQLNLRGNPEDSRFVSTVEDILGQALPTVPNTLSRAGHTVYWLGPDEWLVLSDNQALAELLRRPLEGMHASLNDLSGGQIALCIAGPAVRDVLAKGCTLDLHPRVFTQGMCAQSGLARASVLLGLVDEPDRFDIVVRRSFADYLVRWLRHASVEFSAVLPGP
jgi:sarcosine oxidase subunit gamma